MRNETSRIDQEAWKFADKTLMPHGLGLLIRLVLFIVAIGVAGIGRIRDAIARCRSDSLTAALASIRSPPRSRSAFCDHRRHRSGRQPGATRMSAGGIVRRF